ncbi:MAG: CocE/NonD family hydrolase [Acidobacteria bacterium]|nr:CocE/NonD family hydrolase [Acidobacteriota bacterium]
MERSRTHGAGAKPRVPALHVDTWRDGTGIAEATHLFKYLQDLETPNQFLIIGAGPHCSFMFDQALLETKLPDARNSSNMKVGDLEIGDARYGGDDHGYVKLFLNWFEYWLNSEQNHVTDMPKVQLYVMGKGWNLDDHWPLKATRFTKYFLTGDPVSPHRQGVGMLSTSLPSGNEQDRYVYDPGSPNPTLGGGSFSSIVEAARDQRPVEARKDVLVYSTPPLEKPVTIAGPVEVVLYVSSSALDADFMVKLVDVYPDGKAINLSDDAFRVRYREGSTRKCSCSRARST